MPDLSRTTLAIVCPMANEQDSALPFVRAVLDRCTGFQAVTFFAVLDTVTKDGTLSLLRDLASNEPRLTVVWAPENRCVVDAYVAGYRAALAAGADWILEIDAGFSHNPDQIPQFFERMSQGYDCAFGSRFCPGGEIDQSSLKRYVTSRGGTLLANTLLGTRLKDMTIGFEMFSRRALTFVVQRGIRSKAHFFQTEIKTYCHVFKIVEVPIHYCMPSPRLRTSAIVDAFKQLGRLFLLRLSGRLYVTPKE
jgi:dolichol-phosphate mannosyltransferase